MCARTALVGGKEKAASLDLHFFVVEKAGASKEFYTPPERGHIIG